MQRLLLLIIFCLSGSAASAIEQPKVAVSIKPLHSLVSNIMQGVAEPQLVISAAGSPHGYNLRPSEVRALHQADLVIWIGPEFESFMAKSVGNFEAEKPVLTLLNDAPGMIKYPAREGGEWSRTEDHDKADHHRTEHHVAGSVDPHLWLSPTNADIISRVVTQKLSAIDPANSSQYRSNRDLFLQRLSRLDQDLNRRLIKLAEKKYIVFHDAYQYFEKHYNLQPVGALAIDPERRPGARRLAELKRTIRNLNIECIFSEPQFEPRLIKILTEGSNVRTGILDPLGADLPAGSELYFLLMEQMASALEQGLSGK